VIQVQVAVAVARPAACGAVFYQRPEPSQRRLGQSTEPVEDRLADDRVDLGAGQIEHVENEAGNRVELAEGGYALVRFSLLMEGGDFPRQGFDVLDRDFAPAKALQECRTLREPLHFHGPFRDFALAFDPYAGPWRPHDWNDGQVDMRCEAAIQADLFLAEMAALVERAEVEEARVDWLLDLVCVRAGQENGGNVRLVDLHVSNRVGVGSRVRESLDQVGQLHGNQPRFP
jgi:hypothetical protein